MLPATHSNHPAAHPCRVFSRPTEGRIPPSALSAVMNFPEFIAGWRRWDERAFHPGPHGTMRPRKSSGNALPGLCVSASPTRPRSNSSFSNPQECVMGWIAAAIVAWTGFDVVSAFEGTRTTVARLTSSLLQRRKRQPSSC